MSLSAGPALAQEWVGLINSGFGFTANTSVESMIFYRGDMYAGTRNDNEGCQVWCYNGTTWIQVASGGFGEAVNQAVSTITVYASRLFVGTAASSGGCQVWSYDGLEWTREVGSGGAGTPTAPGFGDLANQTAFCMTVYGDDLYVGTRDSSGGRGCQVWFYDGSGWNQAEGAGFGDSRNFAVSSMAANGLDLYVGTNNQITGCEL